MLFSVTQICYFSNISEIIIPILKFNKYVYDQLLCITVYIAQISKTVAYIYTKY